MCHLQIQACPLAFVFPQKEALPDSPGIFQQMTCETTVSRWLLGGRGMKIRKNAADGELASARREGEVRREIETFLLALSSYPDRFAREPYLSFEQHLFRISLATPRRSATASRQRG